MSRLPATETGKATIGGRVIPYTVRRSARRRKTIEMRVDREARGVVVAAPAATRIAEVEAFIGKRVAWIERRLSEAAAGPASTRFVTGDSVPYLGRDIPMEVVAAGVRRVSVALAEGVFVVMAPLALEGEARSLAIREAFVAWFRTRATVAIPELVARWAPVVGGGLPRAVLIRDQKRRWGSCAPDGTLRFNWRVMQLRPELVDYIVVHELAHRRERNHSARYWAHVAAVMPDHVERRRAMREAEVRLSDWR